MPFGCVNQTHGPSFSSLQQNNTLNLRGDNKKSSLQLFHFPKFLKANSEIAQFCLLLDFKENTVSSPRTISGSISQGTRRVPSGSAAPKGAAFMPFGCVNLTHGPFFSSLQQNNYLNLRGDNYKSSLQLFVFPKFLKRNSEVAQVCLLQFLR